MNIEQIKAAVGAARERQAKGLQDCPFCGSNNLHLIFLDTDEDDLCYRECCECQLNSGFLDNQKLTDEAWNYRPAQYQADQALIALWEMMQGQEAGND